MKFEKEKNGSMRITVSPDQIDLGLQILQSKHRKFTLNDLREYQTRQVDRLQLGIQTPYYHYTLRDSTIPPEERPVLPRGFLEWNWHNAIPIVNRFTEAQNELSDFGKQLLPEHHEGETFLEAGEFVLSRSHTLQDALAAFIATPAVAPQSKAGYTPLMLESVRLMARELGTEKDPAIVETLRRYIPRWLTYPLPVRALDGEALPWVPYTQKRVGFLVDQATIDQGEAPFLIAMKSADKAEAEGDSEKSYAMRTHAVISLLEMERERVTLADNPEVPFFTLIMGGILAGANHEAPKNATYNYASALGEIIRDTFERYQQEKSQSIPSQATAFLRKLAQFYPNSYPKLIGMAMIDSDRLYDGVNLIELIKGLAEEDMQWVSPAITYVQKLAERRILRTSELTELEEGLPAIPEQGVLPAEELIEDIPLVLGSADMFSFQSRLPQVGSPDNQVSYAVSIDLNRISEKIEACVAFTDALGSRYVPFSLSFSGESESLEFALLDTETLNIAQNDRLRSLVATLIHNHANEIRKRRDGKSKRDIKTTDDDEPADPLRIQTLSRDERLVLYQTEKDKTGLIVGKKKTKADDIIASDEALNAPATEQTKSIIIENLNEQQLQALLKGERIQGVSPQNLVDKIRKMAIYASQTKTAFGKKVRKTSGRSEDTVDLRQLKFVTDGGNTGIRVYLEAKGEGTFVIQGILLKKGEKQQSKYITQLTEKIKKQRDSTDTET